MIGQNSSSSFYWNWLNWWIIGDEDWGVFIQQCPNNLMNWLASIMFGFEQMFWALLSILRHFKSPLQFSRVMAHSCFDKVKSWFLSKNFKVFPNAAPLSSSQCYLLRSRRIRRREKLFIALKGCVCVKPVSSSCPAKTGIDGSSLLMSATVTYWIMHALINIYFDFIAKQVSSSF